MKYLITFLCLFPAFSWSQSTLTYTPSTEDFVNPERGFYRYSETRSYDYTLLDSATLVSYRDLHTPFSADYSIYSSLTFRYFFLENFINGNISEGYLDSMQMDFDIARSAGIKLIPRFAYTDITTNCGDSYCMPYGDAPKEIVLQHIEQVKPLLQANKDVILTLQMGFVGIWGENYYTDYFGDASQPPNYSLTATNWNDRNELMTAMLDALPKDRMLQVRYPQQKQKYIYGPNAATTTVPMQASIAFNGSDESRIGFHNDCFLSSINDIGTYIDYSNGSINDTTNLKPYKAADTKFVIVGGETCSDFNPWGNCASAGGIAESEMRRFHYTYLNADYNNDVNDDWENVCMDEIKRNLGYRLQLVESTMDDTVEINNCFSISIQLENVGFASPVNPRDVQIILKHNINDETWRADLIDNPQFWFTGAHVVEAIIELPNCMSEGDYSVYFNLPDPERNIAEKPEYSIRLANQNTWDEGTGWNNLMQTIHVKNSFSSACQNQTEIIFRRNKLNSWIGGASGNWNESISNWSENRIPDLCDEVIIPSGVQINVSMNEFAYAGKLSLESGAELLTQSDAQVVVGKPQ